MKKAPKPKPGDPNRIKKWRGDRPPDAVVEGRTSEMMIVLSNRPTLLRCQLHTEFCPRWGVHWRTVDRIVSRARALLMERLQRSKEIFRCESLAFYEAMTADPKASVSEKTRARQRIDDLLGLDAPKKQELSGPDGGPLDVVPVPTEPQGQVILYLPQKVPLPGAPTPAPSTPPPSSGIGVRGN